MISILIPCYDYNAYPLVSSLEKQALMLGIKFEIICVDDGSFSNKNEIKMLDNVMTQKGLTNQVDKKFAENLITWADIIRKTFYEGGVDEIISTRRLVHIAKAYSIFRNKLKAVEVCTNRFDDDTKQSFIDLYTKIDSGVNPEELMSKESDEPIADEVEADEDII